MSESACIPGQRGMASPDLSAHVPCWPWAPSVGFLQLRWCTRSPRRSLLILKPLPTSRMTGGLFRNKMSCLPCRPTSSFLSFLGSPGHPLSPRSRAFSPSCPVAFPRTSLFGVWRGGRRYPLSLWELRLLGGELPAKTAPGPSSPGNPD